MKYITLKNIWPLYSLAFHSLLRWEIYYVDSFDVGASQYLVEMLWQPIFQGHQRTEIPTQTPTLSFPVPPVYSVVSSVSQDARQFLRWFLHPLSVCLPRARFPMSLANQHIPSPIRGCLREKQHRYLQRADMECCSDSLRGKEMEWVERVDWKVSGMKAQDEIVGGITSIMNAFPRPIFVTSCHRCFEIYYPKIYLQRL